MNWPMFGMGQMPFNPMQPMGQQPQQPGGLQNAMMQRQALMQGIGIPQFQPGMMQPPRPMAPQMQPPMIPQAGAYGGAMGYQDGGAVGYAEGGDIEPELWMESALQENPNEAQIDMADPGERAMLRMQRGVHPRLGRGETPGAPMAALATIAGAGLPGVISSIPTFGGRLAAASAPAIAGLTAAAASGPRPEENFVWNDPIPQRPVRLGAIQTRIDALTGQLQAASPARMGMLNEQIRALNTERDGILGDQRKEREAAQAVWEDNRTRRIAAAEAKRARETSIFDVQPGTRAAIAGLTPFASYGIGKYLGRRLPSWMAIPTAATTGALEGGASIAWPHKIDAATLPEESETQKRAARFFGDKPAWENPIVQGASGISAGFGAHGAIMGAAGRRGKMPMILHPSVRVREPEIPHRPGSRAMIEGPPTRVGTEDLHWDPIKKSWSKDPIPERAAGGRIGYAVRRADERSRLGPLGDVELEINENNSRPGRRGHSHEIGSYYNQNPREDTNPWRKFKEMDLARGGSANQAIPWTQRAASQRLSFAGGMVNSGVPGRTDKLNLNVPAGSYVIPSSVVSSLGQDNTMAGGNVLNAMFKSGPGGMSMSGSMGRRRRAFGGEVSAPPESVPVVVAGGEFIATPDMIMNKWPHLDLETAHKVLDKFVEDNRKQHIDTLKKLPGPVKDEG